MRYLLLLLLTILSSISLADSPVFTNSLNKAKALSKQSQKSIILIFASSSCKYCDMLKNEINSGNLDKLLSDKVICYVDINEYPELKESYNVNMIPDSRFLNKEIEKSRLRGYEKNKYVQWLESLR